MDFLFSFVLATKADPNDYDGNNDDSANDNEDPPASSFDETTLKSTLSCDSLIINCLFCATILYWDACLKSH